MKARKGRIECSTLALREPTTRKRTEGRPVSYCIHYIAVARARCEFGSIQDDQPKEITKT